MSRAATSTDPPSFEEQVNPAAVAVGEGLAAGVPAAEPERQRTTSDKPIAGRRDVSAAQNVRHQAPKFVALDGLELIQLRRFPAWVRWLFLELCAACDFASGELATSYAKLQALLECSQPRQGGQRLPVPSVQQIRRALDDLEEAGMLGRDKAYNTKANGGRGILFLSVGARKNFGTAKANRDRSCDRVPAARKPRRHAASKASAGGVATGVATGVSGAVIPTPIPVNSDLSTGAAELLREVDLLDGAVVVGAGEGEKIGPPRGAESRTPYGVLAPLTADYDRRAKEANIKGRTVEPRPLIAEPGTLRPTIVAQAMRERMRGKSAPPGGQADAPQVGADSLPSARIRRPRKPV